MAPAGALSGHIARYYSPFLFPPFLLPLLRRRISLLLHDMPSLSPSILSFSFSLCTSRSSSRPRSRVHSTADFPGRPFRAPHRLTNMAAVRSLSLSLSLSLSSFAAPAKKRAAKRRAARNSRFAHLNPNYLPYSPDARFYPRNFTRSRKTSRLSVWLPLIQGAFVNL